MGMIIVNKYFFLLLFMVGLRTAYGQNSTLTGTITNEADSAIAGAEVRILPDGPVAVTNESGKFSLVGLVQSTITVTVYAVGYQKHEERISLTRETTERHFRLTVDEQSLGQVEVTGRLVNANTETLVKLENTIMPVTVVDRRTIELMGSRRLDEVMKEQTGVAIVNDIASGSRSVGVQMQGFGSEYVMVLIDGQPMVGRNGGNFDLSRISVSNIERVEITKGSAANIYGGDALGGTINVITKQVVTQPQAVASVAYGSNETVDASLDGEAPVFHEKGSLSVGGNYYHTGGFNTSRGLIVGTTAPPYDNYAGQARFRYRFNDNNQVSVSGRYGLRRSFMSKDFGVKYTTEDVLDETDVNLSANFDHRFSERWRSMTRYYFTHYYADMNVALSQGDSISQTTFGQFMNRVEQQFSYSIPEKLDVITGLGGSIERIDQNILTDIDEIKSIFAYSQANWNILPKLEFTFGLRFDNVIDYGWRLDPSAALQYAILPTLTVKAAYGTAFKAPDMRKLYQVFYNPAYNNMVIGSFAMRNVINAMRESGQVSQYELEPVYDEIKGLALNAEMSKSYNVSLIWETPDRHLRAEGSVFYHDITNQINQVLIGRDVQGGLIYSYRNHAKAYYKGGEVSFSYSPVKDLQVSGGYQYLIAKDRTVGDEIREGGKYFSPLFDPNTGFVNYTPSASDYWGMENRSLHMFNARLFYTYTPLQLSANVRLNYRGKYPFSDRNNNGYVDRFDTFVRDHYLLNAGLEKKFPAQRMSVRASTENMLNFVDQKVPSQPGRVYFVGVSYQLYRDR